VREHLRARAPTVVSLALVVAVVGWPEAAVACPVCFSGREENRLAFILTTVFLTALPLLIIGSAVLWLRARWCELEAEAEAEPAGEVAVPPPAPAHR
jgi:hypothetical protein